MLGGIKQIIIHDDANWASIGELLWIVEQLLVILKNLIYRLTSNFSLAGYLWHLDI